jgi:hypothetical protein
MENCQNDDQTFTASIPRALPLRTREYAVRLAMYFAERETQREQRVVHISDRFDRLLLRP